MNTALWIVAGVLAAAFVAGGSAKLIIPKSKFAAFGRNATWVENYSAGGVKAIGAFEVLGGIGLILPAVTGIAPILVPLAASGLAIIMVGAAITRYRRREFVVMVGDLAYLAATIFVAWGRFVVEPFAS